MRLRLQSALAMVGADIEKNLFRDETLLHITAAGDYNEAL